LFGLASNLLVEGVGGFSYSVIVNYNTT